MKVRIAGEHTAGVRSGGNPVVDSAFMTAVRPLGRAFPALDGMPFLALGEYPTPVEPLDLGGVVPAFTGRAWVKREDCSAPAVGGNKVRKLEYLLGEAKTRGASVIVTAGGLGSNHCLATAFHGRTSGLETHMVLFPHHLTDASRKKFRANCALATGLTFCRWPTATPVVTRAVAARLGARAFSIPPGGSSALGAIGFANAGLELAEQVAAGMLEPPDAVFIAASSAGSAAGLALGLQLAGVSTEVVAVRVYPPPLTSEAWIRRLASRAHARLTALAGAPLRPFDPARIRVVVDQMGPGYAQATPAAERAAEAGRDLGVPLDGTYTAKAFAGFLAAAGSPRYRQARLVFMGTYDPRLPEGLGDDVAVSQVLAKLRPYL